MCLRLAIPKICISHGVHYRNERSIEAFLFEQPLMKMKCSKGHGLSNENRNKRKCLELSSHRLSKSNNPFKKKQFTTLYKC